MIINFFMQIFNSVYQHLPDSWIQNSSLIDKGTFQMITDFLPFLNWFVPFDLAVAVMAVWLPCILTYYIVSSVRVIIKQLMRLFVNKL